MNSLDDVYSNGLALGLGLTPTPILEQRRSTNTRGNIGKPGFDSTLLSLCLISSPQKESADSKKACDESIVPHLCVEVHRRASPNNAASSFSSDKVKRERDPSSEETVGEKVCSRISDEEEDGGNQSRKKLRLTKEQSALLEESFRQHSTLNPKQKQTLARQLNLRPRQVEVWFQNRRARTKLKQTEVDCEFLKKCCETLTDENRRLQKELQELKALKLTQPVYVQMPAATLAMCPSCERIGGGGIADGAPKRSFSMAQKSHFYNSFTNSSAAC